MGTLLLVLWGISPLIAIGVGVFAVARIGSLKLENRALKNSVIQLYQQGRISEAEFRAATGRNYNYNYHSQQGFQGQPHQAYQGQPSQGWQANGQQGTPQQGNPQEAGYSPGGYPGAGWPQANVPPQPGAPQSIGQQPNAQSRASQANVPPLNVQQAGLEGTATGQTPAHTQQSAAAGTDRPQFTRREAFEMEMEAASRLQPSPFAQPRDVTGQMPPMRNMYQRPPRQKNPVNPANIILVLGVMFITVAGLIFATTTWQILPNVMRIAIVFSESLLFFGVSLIAQKKFELKHTSLAFYVLGSVFLPIGVLAVGYFQLFGWWLSLVGPGRYALGLVGSLLLLASALLGLKLHRRKQFLWTAMPCVAFSLAFGVMTVHPSSDTLALVMALYFCGFVLSVKPLIKRLGGAAWMASGAETGAADLSPAEIEAEMVSGADASYVPFLSGLERFALLQLCAGSAWVLYLADSGFLGFAATLFCAIAFLSPQFGSLPGVREDVGMYPFAGFLLASLFFLNGGISETSMILLEAACVLLLLENLKIFPRGARSAAALCAGMVMAAALLSCVFTFGSWSLQMVLAVAVLTAGTTFTILSGQGEGREVRPLLYAHPFLVMVTAYGLYRSYFYDNGYGELLMAAAAVAAFLLGRFIPFREGQRLRTALSDAVFALSCFMVTFVVWPEEFQTLSLLLTLFVLAVCVSDRRPAAFAMPIVVLLTAVHIHDVLGYSVLGHSYRPYTADLINYAVLAAIAALSVASRKRDYARRLQLPFSLALVICGWYYSCQYAGMWWMFEQRQSGFAWLSTAYWIYCLLAPGQAVEWKTLMGKQPQNGEESWNDEKPQNGEGQQRADGTGSGYSVSKHRKSTGLPEIHRWRESVFLLAAISLAASFWLTAIELLPMRDRGWYLMAPAAACALMMALRLLPKVREDAFLSRFSIGFACVGFQLIAVGMVTGFQGGAISGELIYAALGIWVCTFAVMPLHRRGMTVLAVMPVLVGMFFAYYLLIDILGKALLLRPESTVPAVVLFVLCAGVGRGLYKKIYRWEKGVSAHVDWFTICSGLPVLFLFQREATFTGFLFLACYFTLFYKRHSLPVQVDRILLTAAGAALGGAALSQAFRFPEEYRSLFRLAAGGAVVLASHFLIWDSRKKTEPVLLVYTGCAIVTLMLEAMAFRHSAHAFILGIGALLMLFLAYRGKRRSWFSMAVVTLVVVGVYLSRTFWFSIAWWVYLLIAGILLIAAGAVNEKNKQKGTSLKGRLGEFWDDWNW